jgi:hypothetical protein
MKNGIVSVVVAVLLSLTGTAWAAGDFSAEIFAGADKKLNRQEAALWIAYRDKEPLSKFLLPGQMSLDSEKIVAALEYKLDDLRSTTHHEAPWTWQELDAVYKAPKKDATLPGWKDIKGITSEKKLGTNGVDGSLGPLRLRKYDADLMKVLSDAKGATIGFSDNRFIKGHGAWNTAGALGYPVTFFSQGSSAQSTKLVVMPVIGWNLAEAEGGAGNKLDELRFSLPLTVWRSPGGKKMTGTYDENMAEAGDSIYSSLWMLIAKPYIQTDFSFQYEIYGIEASAEYVGGVFGSRLYAGGYQDIGNSGLQYQMRVVPKVDYGITARGGEQTSRQSGDNWLRLGGLLSLDFRLGSLSFNPLDIGVSYDFLKNLDSAAYSDVFRTHATWWLSENAGMTLEYSKGETPVAIKKIDLMTLGLELKY